MEPQANDPAALGIYLLDRRGNRELIYRDPAIGSSHPIPLVPRPVPPILPSMLPSDAPPTGELVMADVYQGLGDDVPRGSIKALRDHPDSAQDHAGGRRAARRAGRAGADAGGPGHRARRAGRVGAVCGSGAQAHPVPGVGPGRVGLSDDAFDHLPAARRDDHVYRLSRAPSRRAGQQDDPALQRPPSQIEPGPDGTRPFSYVRLVQPILDQHCVRCHGGEKVEKGIDLTGAAQDGFTRSYWALCGKSAYGAGRQSRRNRSCRGTAAGTRCT